MFINQGPSDMFISLCFLVLQVINMSIVGYKSKYHPVLLKTMILLIIDMNR